MLTSDFLLEYMRSHGIGVVILGALLVSLFFVFRRSLPAKSHERTFFAPPQGAEWHDPLLEQIVGQTFAGGETVFVDGKHFVRCVFRNCALHYSGGMYEMTDCRREAGTFSFATDNPSIFGALGLLNFIGITREDAFSPPGSPTQ